MAVDPSSLADERALADRAGELLAGVATGDQQAFAELYDLLAPRVFGLVLRVLVDRAQAEEVAQEVFVEVWQAAATFDASRGSAKGWCMTIAHRRAVDRVRASQSSRERDLRIGIRDVGTDIDSVSETVELKVAGEEVAEALAALSEPQREAITLAYFDGLTQRELSETLGVPLGTVKTRIRDGMIRLRAALGVAS